MRPASDQGDSQRGDKKDEPQRRPDEGRAEVAFDDVPRRAPPGEQRPDAHQHQQDEKERAVHLLVEGRADGDLGAVVDLGEQGEDGAPKGREGDPYEEQVVEEEAGLLGHGRVEAAARVDVLGAGEEEEERDREAEAEKGEEARSQGRGGEVVNGVEEASPHHERAEDAEEEGREDEQHVPPAEQAAALFDHDRVHEGGAGEPGEEGDVFDGVPVPEPAPAQDVIGPPCAEHQPDAVDQPCTEEPGPGRAQPLTVRPTRDHRADRQGEGYRPRHVAEQQERRMDEEAGVAE